MAIKLIRPVGWFSDEVMDFRKEMLENGDELDGCAELARMSSYYEWVRYIADQQRDPAPGHAVPEVFLAVRTEDGRLVGMTNYRHPLTEFLREYGGAVGYSVRPSERRKGYAGEILRQLLPICRQYGETSLLICCDPENTGSRKTIEKAGGVLESEVPDVPGITKSGRIFRYRISLQ